MDLAALFEKINPPAESDQYQLSAVPIPERHNHRIAKDKFGNPALLITSIQGPKNPFAGLKLQNISVLYDTKFVIRQDDSVSEHIFTAVCFVGNNDVLKAYFIKLCSALLLSVSNNPSHHELKKEIASFTELFRLATKPPAKTAQGLWAELFFIAQSKDPETLVQYWHCIPEEKFDFNAGTERIEVKSNSYFERVHSFSSEQLNPSNDVQVLIASIFVRQSSSGSSMQELMEEILMRVGLDCLKAKLSKLVIATMGDSLDQALKMRFDNVIAQESLRFFKHQDVPRILEEHIPMLLSEVRFHSDLSKCEEVDIEVIVCKGALFSSI